MLKIILEVTRAMIGIVVVIEFPNLKRNAYTIKRGKVVVVFLSRENFGNIWSFLEPKEK